MICRNCNQLMSKTKLIGGGYWRCMKCNEVAVILDDEKKHEGQKVNKGDK